MKSKKDILDSLTVLEKADIIKNRAEQIKKVNNTLTNKGAYDIASAEILGDGNGKINFRS